MNAASARLAIVTLSKRTGCNIETIRYYERVGLLPAPVRSAGGYRLYETDHLKRLTFIRRARALGFSIDEVRTLLKLADERKRPCAEVRVVAGAHLGDVRAKIADLRAMERVLRKTLVRCARGAGSECPLIEALYREGSGNGSRVDGQRLITSPSSPRSTSPLSRPSRRLRSAQKYSRTEWSRDRRRRRWTTAASGCHWRGGQREQDGPS